VGVDVYSGAKRGFEVGVVGFPSHDLGIGALEVGLVHDVAGVGEEEFADVG
jgi:hypothetical protein